MVQPNSFCCTCGARFLFLVVLFSSALLVAGDACTAEEESRFCPGTTWTCSKTADGADWIYECSDGAVTRDPDCDEIATECHTNAYCVMPKGTAVCFCPPGLYGNGTGEVDLATASGCSSSSYAVVLVINLPDSIASRVASGSATFSAGPWWNAQRESIANLFFSSTAPDHVVTSLHHEVFEEVGAYQVTVNVLFASASEASDGMDAFDAAIAAGAVTLFDTVQINVAEAGELVLDTDTVVWGPRAYRWSAGTTGDALQILPTGMEVDSVSFDFSCMSAGCWVIEVTYTTGEDNFNVFYLPKTDNSPMDTTVPEGGNAGPWYDSNAADHDYDSLAQNNKFPWSTYLRAPGDTFLPSSFPCGVDAYSGGEQGAISACCIEEFLDMYRPVSSFVSQMSSGGTADIRAECDGFSGVLGFNAPGQSDGDKLTMPSPDTGYSLFGTFAGMSESKIESIGLSFTDPTIRQFRARLKLDELELRRFAGQFRGTAGVEHTVDTFVGLVNFKPTGSAALDSFATQTAVHLEKTSYFAVSTHGVNDYTFLDYVNLRLVSVLEEDATLGETEQQQDSRTNRTSSKDPAQFLQITFTLGSQYQPMWAGTDDSETIPLDSLRVGKGTSFSSMATQGTLFHACMEYETPAADNMVFNPDTKGTFDDRLTADCAPAAAMCSNPRDFPDQFVSFNVPLGVGWLPNPDDSLRNQVFVEAVVTAEDKVAKGTGQAPNDGNAPWQMKTTLFAAIPLVRGGVQIFCDQIVAKTDLQDVVNATLLFGSASDLSELTRLRMFADIGDSVLTPRDPVDFESSDSIESGLMTLVLTGDDSYFGITDSEGAFVGSGTYGLQLEDVITVHVMEQDPDFDGAGTVSKTVRDLLRDPGQDNYDSLASDAELRTRGYNLNGAFRFTIDRETAQATLEPTDDLLEHCPFSPARPTLADAFPTTCVTRRDVSGRAYPVRQGATSATATEVVTAESDPANNRLFMQSVLGASDYAATLGEQFSRTIAARWGLNGRYKRAYWINPGYEWTPTQTGGQSVFHISQKLFFFALVALDESFGSRRRALLQSYSAVDASQGGMGVSSTSVGFRTDPATLVAELLEIPSEQVTKWEVKMELTREQACMDRSEMRAQMREQLENNFKASATNILNVQIVYAVVDMGSEDCMGVVVRRATSGSSSATVLFDVLVAFNAESARINPKTLLAQPGVLEFKGVALPEVIVLDASVVPDPDEYTPPPVEEDSPLGLDWTLIYGILGGVGGIVLLLVIFGVRYCHKGRCAKLREAQEAEIVTVMYLRDVKADLADDMFGQSRQGSQEVEDEKMQAHHDFEGIGGGGRRESNDFENAFSSPSKESRGDIF